jgi:hypothetical protein
MHRGLQQAWRPLVLPAEPVRYSRPAACPRGKVGFMADATNLQSFEEIVEWA